MEKMEAIEKLDKTLQKYFDFKKTKVGDGVVFVNIIDEFLEDLKK